MQETRFLKIVIIALLMLNAGTLGFLLFRHPADAAHPPRGRHSSGNTAEFLNRELQLTTAQEKLYEAMRKEHHTTVETLRDNMRSQQKKMYGILSTTDGAQLRHQAAGCIDSIAALQREIERVTFSHFIEFRAICTPQQQRKFDDVISEALDRMR